MCPRLTSPAASSPPATPLRDLVARYRVLHLRAHGQHAWCGCSLHHRLWTDTIAILAANDHPCPDCAWLSGLAAHPTTETIP